MKKNYIFKFILFLIPVSAFILMSSSGGRDDGRTGSPGDSGNTCAQCHTGGSSGTSVAITTNIPNEGYQTNTEYDITVTTTSTASAHGFQLTAEKTSDDGKIGSFTAGTGSRVTSSRITHSNPNQSSWSFKWTSPATDVGDFKFYAASVAANGNNTNDAGDKVVTTSTAGFSVLGLSKEVKLDFALYPNPSTDFLVVQLPSGSLKAEISVFDVSGRLLKTSSITSSANKIDVQDLSTGMYILKIQSEGKTGSKQFIKK
ncbi:MAG: T9SS type A sorting domain-containing protein [Flavobacteriaceae bacterium]|nr:T9SS type A sorting domain-containing protein [Flavobacteriaceae bacterium]